MALSVQSRTFFSVSWIKTVAYVVLALTATDLLAQRGRGRSMERIMHRMTGRVELAKEMSTVMRGKLDAMFPKRTFNDGVLESFSKHLESKVFEGEMSFAELNDAFEGFRKAEIARLEKEGKLVEGMLAKAHLESFTTRDLKVRHLQKHVPFEALTSGGSKKVTDAKTEAIEAVYRTPNIPPKFANKIVAVVKTQLKTVAEITMMQTMLRVAVDYSLRTKLGLEASFKNVIEFFFGKKKKELLEQCFKKVGAGGAAVGPSF